MALTGQLDAQSAPGLRQLLTELLTDPAPQVVIDLTGTTHLDATGLGVLVRAARRTHDAGAQLRVAAPTPPILDVCRSPA